jgi:DnaD/phage-associated family protein
MPWVKLWTEMLDDPKLAELTAAEKWLFVQLILLAGECDRDGDIPLTFKQIAWRLRLPEDELISGCKRLIGVTLIDTTGDKDVGLIIRVVSFGKRQDRPQSVKQQQWLTAQRKHREKSSDVIHDTSMTNTLVIPLEEEEEEEEEVEVDKNTAAASACYRAYTSEIGVITPMISDAIDLELKDGTPPDYITDAIKEAARNNVRNWAYIAAILKRWKVEGKKTRKRGTSGQPADYSDWAGDGDAPPEKPPEEVNYWTKTIGTLGVDKALMEKLEHTKYIGIEGDKVMIGAPPDDIDLLRSRIGSSAQRALVGVIGRQVKLQFVEAY